MIQGSVVGTPRPEETQREGRGSGHLPGELEPIQDGYLLSFLLLFYYYYYYFAEEAQLQRFPNHYNH